MKNVEKDISWVLKYIEELLKYNPEFTGRISLNFFNGGCANINKTESVIKLTIPTTQ